MQLNASRRSKRKQTKPAEAEEGGQRRSSKPKQTKQTTTEEAGRSRGSAHKQKKRADVLNRIAARRNSKAAAAEAAGKEEKEKKGEAREKARLADEKDHRNADQHSRAFGGRAALGEF